MLVLLGACARPEPPPLPPVDDGPTPVGDLVLTVGPAAPGLPVRFRVDGLRPGDALDVAWTRAGLGDEPLEGVLTGLARPEPGPAGVADASFAARAEAVLPLRAGERWWAQGLVRRVDGGREATGVVAGRARDPSRVVTGPVVVDGPAGLAALAEVEAVLGDLRFEGAGVAAIALPALAEVGGDLAVWDDPAVETVALPALRAVGGDLSLYADDALAAVDLPALASVGGSLAAHRAPALARLDAPALRTCGALYVYHDDALGAVSLPALEVLVAGADLWELPALAGLEAPRLRRAGGGVDALGLPGLGSLSLPSLAEVGGLRIRHADALRDLALPALAAVTGDVGLEWDRALASLQWPALAEVRGDFALVHLPGLSALSLPALARVGGDLSIRGVGLGACDVAALRDQVEVRGEVVCRGVIDDGCPGCAP
jgi:hypothetical protein